MEKYSQFRDKGNSPLPSLRPSPLHSLTTHPSHRNRALPPRSTRALQHPLGTCVYLDLPVSLAASAQRLGAVFLLPGMASSRLGCGKRLARFNWVARFGCQIRCAVAAAGDSGRVVGGLAG
jgi:hypothetical protein